MTIIVKYINNQLNLLLIFKKMNKTTLVTIFYILGILVGALFLDVWSADTSFVKTISVFVWTIIFLIALFYFDKNEKK